MTLVTPSKISQTPLHARSQSPVKTPATKSITPWKISLIPSQISRMSSNIGPKYSSAFSLMVSQFRYSSMPIRIRAAMVAMAMPIGEVRKLTAAPAIRITFPAVVSTVTTV